MMGLEAGQYYLGLVFGQFEIFDWVRPFATGNAGALARI
jgi:hypothetical protein